MEADERWKESDDDAHAAVSGVAAGEGRVVNLKDGLMLLLQLSLPINSLMALMSDRMLEVALTYPVKPPDDVNSTSTL